ncbi:hypothetical protein B0H10DRAFT_2214482 [Mycena sp. CBHHK59/15]|nr:hypothetical protein B0H10DRAFT_2214482 [Mycena sp. CBHHK59/15]
MLIKHSDDDHFIILMAGLHNFINVCRVLPRSLTELKPLHEDRIAFHKEMALQAQGLGTQKRTKTAEKDEQWQQPRSVQPRKQGWRQQKQQQQQQKQRRRFVEQREDGDNSDGDGGDEEEEDAGEDNNE